MSLSQVKGQEQAINFIQSILKEDNLAGAYLFIGPKGVGKSFTAKNLAKAVNCLVDSYSSCDVCESCVKIDNLNHPDIHIIAPGESGSIKIEDVRNIQNKESLRPFEAKKKVFILEDADTLTEEASNCFLKTLEEPKKSTLFILTTSKPNLILDTIASRCQKVYFSLLDREEIREILIRDYNVDKIRGHYLSYSSEGKLGLALMLNEGEVIQHKNSVIDAFMFSSGKDVQIQSDDNKRKNLIDSLQILLGFLRDVYMFKIGSPDKELINLDRKHDIYNVSKRYSVTQIEELIKFLDESILNVNSNVNIKLIINFLKEKLWKI